MMLPPELHPCTRAAWFSGAPGLSSGTRVGRSIPSGPRDAQKIIKSWRNDLSMKTKQAVLVRPSSAFSDGNLVR